MIDIISRNDACGEHKDSPETRWRDYSAVQVTAADFNPALPIERAFDGSPFSWAPAWLKSALEDGRVSLAPSRGADYAEWAVVTLNGAVQASAGDWIIETPTGDLVVWAERGSGLNLNIFPWRELAILAPELADECRRLAEENARLREAIGSGRRMWEVWSNGRLVDAFDTAEDALPCLYRMRTDNVTQPEFVPVIVIPVTPAITHTEAGHE